MYEVKWKNETYDSTYNSYQLLPIKTKKDHVKLNVTNYIHTQLIVEYFLLEQKFIESTVHICKSRSVLETHVCF